MDIATRNALHNLNLHIFNSYSHNICISQTEENKHPWPEEGQEYPKAFTWPELMEKHQPSAFAQDPMLEFNISDDQQPRNIKISTLLPKHHQEALA